MAVTQNTYTGNGSTVLFSFTFPYLETTDIKVSVNGTNTTAYTLANATTIQFNTAPANGAAIRIYRETDDAALAATFYPGSAIRSSDLNENFTQNLYVTQESTNNAVTAITTANTALTNSNTAISTANSAISTANTASTNASTAVSTANTASTNASTAVSTANTASTNATAAVNTANTAATDASNAVTTANTASSNASTALSTANTAASDASTALSTANTASTNATTAVNTANNALSTANSATTTANTASTNATAALNAVANSLQYVLVANVAAIPSSPSNNYAIELADSTGIESFTPLANRPAGFVGDAGLSVRMQYSTTGPTWNWLNYFPNNAETRYLKLSGGTLTGQLRVDDSTSVAAPVIAFDGDTNTGLAHTGADELALVTGGAARLTVDSAGAVAVTNALSVGGQAAVVTNDARLSDTRTPTDGSVTNAKVSATAAIAGTKISPDFGSQNVTTTGTVTGASLNPTSSSVPANGVYLPAANTVGISTNGTGRLFIDASGRILFGTPSSRALNVTFDLQYETATGWGQSLIRNSNDAFAAVIGFGKSRGTSIGSNVIVQNNDRLGALNFYGSDGASLSSQAATIEVFADGTPSTGSIPGRISFATTLSGSANPAERLRITSSGNVGINTTSPIQLLHVNGNAVVGGSPAAAYSNFTVAGTSGIQSATPLLNFVNAAGSTRFGYIYHNGTGGNIDILNQENGGLTFGTNNTERARIDSSGRLLVGTSTSTAVNEGEEPFLQIKGTDSRGGVSLVRYSNDGASCGLYIGKSRGTSIGSNTVVQNNDELGRVTFSAADGTDLNTVAAGIFAFVDGTPGTNDMPGRIVLSTTLDGASLPTEALRITNDAVVAYNQAAPAAVNTTATLTVANLKTGIITSTTPAAVTMTLPTGTLTEGGFSGAYNNMTFEWSVINTGGTNAVTVQAGTDHTLVGSGTVSANNSGRFATRRTALNTWVTYRLSS